MTWSMRWLIAILLLAGCNARPAGDPPLVLAPSSMEGPLDAVIDAYVAAGHQRPVVSYAATSALARQLMSGARADIIITADAEWMDRVADRQLIDPASRADLAGNALVVVQQAGNNAAGSRDPASAIAAAGPDARIAIADPDSVPAGRYARMALIRIDLWDSIAPRLVRAENVRAALALTERGAVPLAIVYATDARLSSKVAVAARFPSDSHPPIRYPVARLAAAPSPDADLLRRYLTGEKAQAILRGHGFTAP